jgi:predicted GIY-YIG superfamily endonuclease
VRRAGFASASLDHNSEGGARSGGPIIWGEDMKYVYILQSEADIARFYVGLTDDLRNRLPAHNAGRVAHTSKHRPWRIKTYVPFSDDSQAVLFERYLKSSSGRAFAKKRL